MTGFKRLDGASFFRVGSVLSGFIILWWKIQKGRFSYDRLRCSGVQRAFECRIRKVKKSIHPVTGCAAVRKTGWDSDCDPAFRAGGETKTRKGFRRTEKTDRCRDVYGGWQAGSEGHNAGSGLAWDFDPEAGRLV